MIIYGVSLFIINKKQGGLFRHLFTGVQLHRDRDEREKHITRVASRATYFAAIIVFSLMIVVPVLLLPFGSNIDYYAVSIWSPIIGAMFLNVIFSVSWCIEEKK